MDPDRNITPHRFLEQRQEFGSIERLARSIRIQLNAECPELIQRTLHFFQGGVRIVHGQGRSEAEETIMVLNQFRQSIVSFPRQFRRLIRPGKDFQWRQRKRDHLDVVAKLVEDSKARLYIDNRLNIGHALANIFAARARINVLVEKFLGKDVIKDVNFHAAGFFLVKLTAIAAKVAIKAGTAAAQNTRLASPP